MAKLDRLGWAAGIAFESYGLKIGVRTNTAEVIPRLLEYLPPGWTPAASPVVDLLYTLTVGGDGPRPGVRKYNLLYAGAGRIGRSMDLGEVLESLESDVQMYVAEMARERVFVHAGVVAWDGRAIVMPGRSYSGKTSLTAAFVRAGATYYSDEYAVLDGQGRVHPFARALHVRDATDGQMTRTPIEHIGGTAGETPLPVGLVLVTGYMDAGRWRPRRLSPGQGVLALLANTVPARREPALAMATLQQAVAHATVLKGRRGEADEVVANILANIDTQRDGSRGRREGDLRDDGGRTVGACGWADHSAAAARRGTGVRHSAAPGPLPEQAGGAGVAGL